MVFNLPKKSLNLEKDFGIIIKFLILFLKQPFNAIPFNPMFIVVRDRLFDASLLTTRGEGELPIKTDLSGIRKDQSLKYF